jgi:hypothetical protein
MHFKPSPVPLLAALILAFAGCATPPPRPPSPPPAPVVVAPPPPVEIFPEGIYVSPPKTGNFNAAFDQSIKGGRTFPNNQIGARLIFSSNLKMPRLEAIVSSPDTFQLRIRFANPGNEHIHVSLSCTYADDDKGARRVKNLAFPVNTYRDIAIDLKGTPERTLYIRATAAP